MFINYIDECFTVKYTTRTIRTKSESGIRVEYFPYILTVEDVGDIIFHFFHGCLPKNYQFVFMLKIKKKIEGGLKK